jgi:hypothetical protein
LQVNGMEHRDSTTSVAATSPSGSLQGSNGRSKFVGIIMLRHSRAFGL